MSDGLGDANLACMVGSRPANLCWGPLRLLRGVPVILTRDLFRVAVVSTCHNGGVTCVAEWIDLVFMR